MNIIEIGTGKQMDFLEKVNKSAWKKWLFLTVVLLLLLGGIVLISFFPLVFAQYDFISIALFVVAASYFLIRVLRMK